MEGYFAKDEQGKGLRVPTGRLRIEVVNLSEFRELIEKAKHEADQLQKTINQLRSFNLEIDFSCEETISSES